MSPQCNTCLLYSICCLQQTLGSRRDCTPCTGIHQPISTSNTQTFMQEVRVLDQSGLVAVWSASDSFSIAASCGSLIAAAHGDSVTVVSVDVTDGQPTPVRSLHFSHQVSAVAVLELPEALAQVRLGHQTEMQYVCIGDCQMEVQCTEKSMLAMCMCQHDHYTSPLIWHSLR